jgi:hypothetical protein
MEVPDHDISAKIPDVSPALHEADQELSFSHFATP